jgi:hypothetical protein
MLMETKHFFTVVEYGSTKSKTGSADDLKSDLPVVII